MDDVFNIDFKLTFCQYDKCFKYIIHCTAADSQGQDYSLCSYFPVYNAYDALRVESLTSVTKPAV